MTDEVRLFRSSKEREKWENLADLYSIFIATENLEKSYIRDFVSADEYDLVAFL